MRQTSSETTYPHPWHLVFNAYNLRYPTHPRLPLLLEVSEISNQFVAREGAETPVEIDVDADANDGSEHVDISGALIASGSFVQRIVRKCRVAIEAPAWVRKVINQHDVTFVQTTVIDYANRKMTVDSINETFRARGVILEETCIFREHPTDPKSTLKESLAKMTLPKFPLAGTCEKLMVKSYESNTAKGVAIDNEFIADLLSGPRDNPALFEPTVAPLMTPELLEDVPLGHAGHPDPPGVLRIDASASAAAADTAAGAAISGSNSITSDPIESEKTQPRRRKKGGKSGGEHDKRKGPPLTVEVASPSAATRAAGTPSFATPQLKMKTTGGSAEVNEALRRAHGRVPTSLSLHDDEPNRPDGNENSNASADDDIDDADGPIGAPSGTSGGTIVGDMGIDAPSPWAVSHMWRNASWQGVVLALVLFASAAATAASPYASRSHSSPPTVMATIAMALSMVALGARVLMETTTSGHPYQGCEPVEVGLDEADQDADVAQNSVIDDNGAKKSDGGVGGVGAGGFKVLPAVPPGSPRARDPAMSTASDDMFFEAIRNSPGPSPPPSSYGSSSDDSSDDEADGVASGVSRTASHRAKDGGSAKGRKSAKLTDIDNIDDIDDDGVSDGTVTPAQLGTDIDDYLRVVVSRPRHPIDHQGSRQRTETPQPQPSGVHASSANGQTGLGVDVSGEDDADDGTEYVPARVRGWAKHTTYYVVDGGGAGVARTWRDFVALDRRMRKALPRDILFALPLLPPRGKVPKGKANSLTPKQVTGSWVRHEGVGCYLAGLVDLLRRHGWTGPSTAVPNAPFSPPPLPPRNAAPPDSPAEISRVGGDILRAFFSPVSTTWPSTAGMQIDPSHPMPNSKGGGEKTKKKPDARIEDASMPDERVALGTVPPLPTSPTAPGKFPAVPKLGSGADVEAAGFVLRAVTRTEWHQEFLVLTRETVRFYGRHGLTLEFPRSPLLSLRRLPSQDVPWHGSHFAEVDVNGTSVAIAVGEDGMMSKWVVAFGEVTVNGRQGSQSNHQGSQGSHISSSRCVILNRQKVHFGPPGDAEEISAAVLGGALELIGGRGGENALRDYVDLSTRLQACPVRGLSNEERLAVFMNVYHALLIHTLIEVGATKVPRRRLYRLYAYDVGGHVLTLAEIEHGILRAPLSRPVLMRNAFLAKFLVPRFGSSDPRSLLALTRPFPLLTLNMAVGTVSSPEEVPVLRAATVKEQLEEGARRFIAREVTYDRGSNTFTVPTLIGRWYRRDFGGDGTTIVRTLARWMDGEAAAVARSGAPFKVRFSPYDWTRRARLHPRADI